MASNVRDLEFVQRLIGTADTSIGVFRYGNITDFYFVLNYYINCIV
jgi:hypothetical protein